MPKNIGADDRDVNASVIHVLKFTLGVVHLLPHTSYPLCRLIDRP